MIQQLHSQIHTQEKLERMSTEELAYECSYQHYSPEPKSATRWLSTGEWIYTYGRSYNDMITIMGKY